MPDAGGITPRRNGLRVDRAKVERWQRDAAKRYAAKRRAAGYAAKLTTRINRPSRSNDWPAKVRAAAARRSGGVCEIDQLAPATDLHHRKHRRHRDHRITNALHVCRDCHRKIHAAPSWSYTRGFMVRTGDDPASVAIVINPDTRVFLTVDGNYREAA